MIGTSVMYWHQAVKTSGVCILGLDEKSYGGSINLSGRTAKRPVVVNL